MSAGPPRLSKVRTFVLWAFAVVWFGEMLLWGVWPLSEWWTRVWQIAQPEDPQLAAALYITHAFEAAAKGALGVLAVFALRSRSPSARTALFVPMALVPPLNLAFQFRAQGFLPGPTTVGVTFTIVLWGSFFLFRDLAGDLLPATAHAGRSRLESISYIWLGANAALLTLAAAVFLFAPATGLRSTFPCLSGLLGSSRGVPSGLTHTALAVGSHLSAVAVATWIATVHSRSNPAVRDGVTAASILQAALVCVLPLRLIAMELGRPCATSSVVIWSVPLFAGWIIYAALAHHAARTTRVPVIEPAMRAD